MYDHKAREVRIYVTATGRKPLLDWLEGLGANVRAVIRARLGRIRAGNFGDTKSLGEGIYELRIDFGPGYRIYYGLDGETIVLLLSGGDKSTQAKDIKQAKVYWDEYKKSNKESFEREL